MILKSFFTFCLLIIGSAFANSVEKLVILGAGPAGLSSAIYAGQAQLSPLIIEGNECDGQLVTVFHIENYPGFPEGINGEELIERLKVQALKFGTRFHSGPVTHVDLSQRPFKLSFENGSILETESLIIALGTSKRWLGLDSEKELMDHGVSGSATCDAPLFLDKSVVVTGGGDAALEEALAVANYAAKVTIVYRGDKFNANSYLQERIFSHPKIQVIWNTAIEDILDVTQGKVTALVLHHLKTGTKSQFPCDGLFVAIGRQPNTSLFKNQLKMNGAGLLEIQPHGTQTSIPGVFAAGDVCDSTYKKAITAAGSGCMAGLDVIKYLSEK